LQVRKVYQKCPVHIRYRVLPRHAAPKPMTEVLASSTLLPAC
jgi:hypothetical protein